VSAARVRADELGPASLQPVLESLLEDGARPGAEASGCGMEPTIRPGDRLVIVPFLGLPRPGQIVAVDRGGRLVVRRLIEVTVSSAGRLYRLQGDAEAAPGLPARRRDLLGRITALVRQGRPMTIDESPAALRRVLLCLARRRRRLRRAVGRRGR
jgi:hypothetical protein